MYLTYLWVLYVYVQDHDSSSFRSRGFILLTVVPQYLEQCWHMLSTDWLKEKYI